MEQKSPSLINSSLTYGCYLSLVGILLSVIIWAGGIIESLGLFGSLAIGFAIFVITFFVLWVFAAKYRNNVHGGYIDFLEVLKFTLLVILFSTIISTIYNYIFHSFIDPEYMKNIMTVMQQKTLTLLENSGASEAQIQDTMAKFEEIPTVTKTLLQGVKSGLIGGVIMSLIVSLIVRKKNEDIQ